MHRSILVATTCGKGLSASASQMKLLKRTAAAAAATDLPLFSFLTLDLRVSMSFSFLPTLAALRCSCLSAPLRFRIQSSGS